MCVYAQTEGLPDGVFECWLFKDCRKCDSFHKCAKKKNDVEICDEIKRLSCPFIYMNPCEEFSSEIFDEYSPENFFSSLSEDDCEGEKDNILRSFED